MDDFENTSTGILVSDSGPFVCLSKKLNFPCSQACRERIARLYWSYVLTVLENISRIDIGVITDAIEQPLKILGVKESTSLSSLAAMASAQAGQAKETPEGAGMAASPSTASAINTLCKTLPCLVLRHN